MAEDDVGFVGVEFGVGARGELAHWDEGCARDGGGLCFPCLADVEQGWSVRTVFAELQVGFGSDFGIEHRYRINGESSGWVLVAD